MNWLQFAVQWLHVLLGITWFGYAIAMYFLVAPPLYTLGEDQQRLAFTRLGAHAARVFPYVCSLVLILGVVRGTVFGPIQSFEALTTWYGITFIVALVATIGLFVNGARNIAPAMEALQTTPDFPAAAERLRAITRVDLVLFGVVFTCMILMRFGY